MSSSKILLVDDDFEFVKGMASRLRRDGFEVSSCLSGTEALQKLASELFDVAILDVRMPEMDGLTLLDEIKNLRPEIEAILLTGYASVQTGVDGMNKGAYDFLVKPISFEVLVARINSAYAKKQAHDDLKDEERTAKVSSKPDPSEDE